MNHKVRYPGNRYYSMYCRWTSEMYIPSSFFLMVFSAFEYVYYIKLFAIAK